MRRDPRGPAGIAGALLAAAALACAHTPVPPGTSERAEALCRARPEGHPEAAFTTDGCSAWPDGDWLACCIEHDMAYWCGGTCEQRAAADRELRRCVAERRSAALGWLMWSGVRVGGYPLLPLPWRWGYGTHWPTLYSAPAQKETQ